MSYPKSQRAGRPEPRAAEHVPAMSFNIGHTQVEIYDDYCRGKSKEKVEEILRRIARMALDAFSSDSGREVLAREES